MHKRSTRLAALGLLLALPAGATVVIAQSLEEMARTSPIIVVAAVGQVQSAWDERHTTIETWAEVLVKDALKGKVQKGQVLMVRNPGGEVGDRGAFVAGSPRFKQGEEVLLFLEPAADARDVWLVSALAAGKVTFQKNALGELKATRDLRGLAFYQQASPKPKVFEVSKPEDLGTPEAFLARIRAALKGKVQR